MNTSSPSQAAIGANPLDQLADIHLPPPVANFPWAPGWWALLVLTISLTALALWLWRRYHKRTAYRRAAKAELAALQSITDDAEFARELNQLLRRVAIHSQSTTSLVAGLSGAQWQAFLLNSCGNKPAFNEANLDALAAAAYQAQPPTLDRQQLLKQARLWVKRHRGDYV